LPNLFVLGKEGGEREEEEEEKETEIERHATLLNLFVLNRER